MAYSYKEYTSRDAGQREFVFTFDAVAKNTTNIKVTVGGRHLYDGVTEYNTTTRFPGSGSTPAAEYTVSSGSITIKNTVTFSVGSATVTSGVPTLSSSVPLRIYRETNRSSAEVSFASGSILSDSDLNKANDQARFLGLEAVDRAGEAMVIDADDSTQYDIQVSGADKRIYGVEDPTNSNDAASKAYVDGVAMGSGAGIVTETGEQTLTSKTLTSPDINSPDIDGGTINGITDLAVADGGTGVSTLADGGLVVGNAGSAVEVVAAGATTEVLVGGGAGIAPVWTTATGSGAPVRATSPTLTTPALGTPSSGTLTSCSGTASGLTVGAVTNGVYTNSDTTLGAGVDIETSTTGKIKQKGAFMQSSTHQALTLGY